MRLPHCTVRMTAQPVPWSYSAQVLSEWSKTFKVCCARSAAGGFPAGDEGSGADLGLQAIRLTQQALDGRRDASALTEAILQHVGGSRDTLLEWSGRANQNTYASCAPLVFAAAPADACAQGLVTLALDSLCAIAQALDPHERLPLVVAGSIGQQLMARLPRSLTHRLVAAQGDAMHGALQLLLRTLCGPAPVFPTSINTPYS